MKTKLSKALSLILAVVLAFGAIIPAFASDEIPEGYTPIYTAEDLNNIRNNLSGNYILMNDIDLSEYNWVAIGTYEEPFTGTFDGNGRLIKNLNINCASADTSTVYCGLFGKTSEATVKNVTFYNAQISAKHTAEQSAQLFSGVVVGYGFLSKITNCAVSGKISSEGFSKTSLGGIIGTCGTDSEVNYCSNYADIESLANAMTNSVYIGGITGNSSNPVVRCSNFGNITVKGNSVSDDAKIRIGGIVGSNIEMWVAGAYNTGTISVDFSLPGIYIGGISGCLIMGDNLYNRGLIKIPENFSGCAGALSGNLEPSQGGFGISYCIDKSYYLTTDLSAGYANGIHPDNMLEDKYGYYYSSAIELTDEEMKNQASFAGFDFDNVWVMEKDGYPVLRNQPALTVKENLELKKGEAYAPKSFESWESTDETVVTVNENGEIVALSAGSATFTIEYAYGFYTEYTVTVTEPTVTPDPNPDPEPPIDPDPDPTCWLLKILNLIKKVWNFVINLAGDLLP